MRFLLLVLAIAAGAAQTNPGTIEGRVLNSATQKPISDVQITLMGPPSTSNLSPEAAARLKDQITQLIDSGHRNGLNPEAIDTAGANAQRSAGAISATSMVTDTEGRFSFKNLPPGRYTVRANRDGFFGPPMNGTAAATVTRSVNVAAGTINAMEIALTQGGIISGRVRDPNGQAVSGLSVVAYRVSYNNGRKVWVIASSKTTDDRGEYRISWLPPGEYHVGVRPRNPTADPQPQDNWAHTFFPNVTAAEAAAVILINKGGEAAGIDIDMLTRTSGLLKISGVVKNPYAALNGKGVVDTSVTSFFIVSRPGLLDQSVPHASNALPVNARQRRI